MVFNIACLMLVVRCLFVVRCLLLVMCCLFMLVVCVCFSGVVVFGWLLFVDR